MKARQTTTNIAAVQAVCQDCGWTSQARNAMANAARHHDAHEHAVTVEEIRLTTFGDPNAQIRGQMAMTT